MFEREKINRLNTSTYSSEEIVAIYKVNTICKFMDYNEYVSKIIDGVWHENYKGFKLRDFNLSSEKRRGTNINDHFKRSTLRCLRPPGVVSCAREGLCWQRCGC